jgi:wyosine [tRNA(Phe)-imidazoG37] synthetase (radical SAM superfamily)
MEDMSRLIAFGPVPSRRLGQSLGINNIPPKSCSYSCIYCQVGLTLDMTTERKEFYRVDDIFDKAREKILGSAHKEEVVDCLTFVPDGEPTLDINLGRTITMLKQFGIKIAVITNASLLWKDSVRDDLCLADWVSVKIDAVSEGLWRKINRPHRALKLDNILSGISKFSDIFEGKLATETMLIQGMNDSDEEIKKIAVFTSKLRSPTSYISIPTRPPAEKEIKAPEGDMVNRAYQLFKEQGVEVEYLIGYEGNSFAFTGDVEQDLLSITAVHPMKEEAVGKFLLKANENWKIVEDLIMGGKLMRVRYRNQNFYMRKI